MMTDSGGGQMKSIRVSEATQLQLDWLVAKCLGEREDETLDPLTWLYTAKPTGCWDFCTNWSQGGPLIEREGISIYRMTSDWSAAYNPSGATQDGPTPLIAAMRCYVASRLGEEVEVPDELA